MIAYYSLWQILIITTTTSYLQIIIYYKLLKRPYLCYTENSSQTWRHHCYDHQSMNQVTNNFSMDLFTHACAAAAAADDRCRRRWSCELSLNQQLIFEQTFGVKTNFNIVVVFYSNEHCWSQSAVRAIGSKHLKRKLIQQQTGRKKIMTTTKLFSVEFWLNEELQRWSYNGGRSRRRFHVCTVMRSRLKRFRWYSCTFFTYIHTYDRSISIIVFGGELSIYLLVAKQFILVSS